MGNWHEQYLGREWACPSQPPKSYTCGELVRSVYLEQLGIYLPEIIANANLLLECSKDIQSFDRYNLFPLEPDEYPKEFDVAYLSRGVYCSHVGIGVDTKEGLLILHCMQGAGVTLNSGSEFLGLGYRKIAWHRYKDGGLHE